MKRISTQPPSSPENSVDVRFPQTIQQLSLTDRQLTLVNLVRRLLGYSPGLPSYRFNAVINSAGLVVASSRSRRPQANNQLPDIVGSAVGDPQLMPEHVEVLAQTAARGQYLKRQGSQ